MRNEQITEFTYKVPCHKAFLLKALQDYDCSRGWPYHFVLEIWIILVKYSGDD